jgi:hypothetical protein
MVVRLSALRTGLSPLHRNIIFLLWYSFLLEVEWTPWPSSAGILSTHRVSNLNHYATSSLMHKWKCSVPNFMNIHRADLELLVHVVQTPHGLVLIASRPSRGCQPWQLYPRFAFWRSLDVLSLSFCLLCIPTRHTEHHVLLSSRAASTASTTTSWYRCVLQRNCVWDCTKDT